MKAQPFRWQSLQRCNVSIKRNLCPPARNTRNTKLQLGRHTVVRSVPASASSEPPPWTAVTETSTKHAHKPQGTALNPSWPSHDGLEIWERILGELPASSGDVKLEDLELLARIFGGFSHLPCSSSQSEDGIKTMQQLFKRFILESRDLAASSQQSSSSGLWPSLSKAGAQALLDAVHALDDAAWFPKYGCVLMEMSPRGPPALSVGAADPASDINEMEKTASDEPADAAEPVDTRVKLHEVDMFLLGLDDWRFSIHSAKQGLQHSAACGGHSLLHCGTTTDVPAFFSSLHKAIQIKVSEAAAAARGGGQAKHQHTPAFLHAAIREVLDEMASSDGGEGKGSAMDSSSATRLPQGGFTDVGQHTGSQARDTCWPLVQEALKAALGQCYQGPYQYPDLLLKEAFAHFELWLLVRQVQALAAAPEERCTPQLLSACVQMLRSAATKAAHLSDDGVEMSAFESACHAIKQQLEDAASLQALAAARSLVLDREVLSSAGAGGYSLPTGVIPAVMEAGKEATGLAGARKRAEQNLSSRQLPAYSINLYSHILKSLTAADPEDDMEAQLRLRDAERELFARATLGIDSSALKLDDRQMSQLQEVVDAYRELLRQFMLTDACKACMRAELRSRELLVVWVAHCLVHAAARRQYPGIMGRYGMAVHWEDLRHLVLSDKEAVDAALCVSAYLHKHQLPGKELFSLRDRGAATFDMAGEFASANMTGIWAAEQKAAEARRQGHWQVVQRQQQEAAWLRRQLQEQRAIESSLSSYCSDNSHYDSHDNIRFGLYAWERAKLQDKKSELRSVRSVISSLESQLRTAETPPPAVIQPLPKVQHRALPWVFFLHMPPLFRQLSRLSFLAQQMLLPSPSTHSALWQSITVDPQPLASLVQHYNYHQNSQYAIISPQTGSDGRVMLVAQSIPAYRPPGHIDQYYSADDGVWHPDEVDPQQGWQGSGSSCDAALGLSGQGFFDPFTVLPAQVVELLFTETLPRASNLEWAMHTAKDVAATPGERGNMAVARQDQRPAWVSKPGFLALGGMRAQGIGQLRRLCDALHQRQLPLSQPEVVTLVRQVVYHIGTLEAGGKLDGSSSGAAPALLWRTDWGSQGDMLPTLCRELSALADELDQTPREHDAVLLLGELAAYLAAWHDPCRVVARRFASMTSRVADELEDQVGAEAGNDAVQQQLQAKQCKLRMVSLLCFGTLALEAQDASQVVQLTVQVQHGHVFMEHVAKEQQECLDLLHVRCHNVAARQALDLVKLAEADHGMLTAAVACVLERTPPQLSWLRMDKTGSFESVGPDGHVYHINILDGTVLLDGLPPGRLPNSILRHRLYQRTFGKRNFEVAFTARGELQTLKAVGGRFYDFRMGGDEQLVIKEIDTQQKDVCLELLDVGEGEDCKPWGDQLPVRLRQLHSHWYCRKRNIIVLRPPHFQSYSTHFIIQAAPSKPWQRELDYTCWNIPLHLQDRPWTSLLPSLGASDITEQLVIASEDSVAKRVLSKLEDPAFIHTYVIRNSSSSSSSSSSRGGSGRQPLHQSQVLWELPRLSTGLRFLQQGGELLSQDYVGYKLAHTQQLCQEQAKGGQPQQDAAGRALYTLAGFQQYLVLERMPGTGSHNTSCARRPDCQVLVPAGHVVCRPSGQVLAAGVQHPGLVYVQLPQGCGDKIKFHTYQVHARFGDLRATSKLARLQLAALYAGTSSLLPEPLSRATGAQMAMQLLRQCWGNKPLAAEESSQLSNVVALAGHLASALHLVAAELLASSTQLSHLHTSAGGGDGESVAVEPDAASCYLQPQGSVEGEYQGWCYNPRMLLTQEEELRVLGGVRRSRQSPPFWFRSGQARRLEVQPCPVPASVIPEIEQQICDCVAQTVSGAGGSAYPLTALSLELPLEREMHEELQGSWQAWHSTPQPQLKMSYEQLKANIKGWQSRVSEQRQSMEAYLLSSLTLVPADTPHGTSFRLLRSSGAVPLPSLLDLACVAASAAPHVELRLFNPFLGDAACSTLVQGISTWLQLCVLEDRLGRLEYLANESSDMEPTLIKELLVQRTWDAQQHPDWLVFEAEGQLQIRPAQYWVTQHLLKNPGAIDQLNMGEGKTRVIMPMLALYWTRQTKGRRVVVRLNLLSTLLEEAYDHLHVHLCASIQGRRLFTLPFHRDVVLTTDSVKAMTAAVRFCQQVGGLLLVAPEHRLSLQLKYHEIRSRGNEPEVCDALEELAALPYCDLLDESDELLNHRLQLVYAWGTPSELPSLTERASVLQALLREASAYADRDQQTAKTMSGVAVWTPEDDRPPGGFSGLRLLPGKSLDAVAPTMLRDLAEAIMSSSSYELQWLQTKPTMKDQLLQCMLKASRDAHHLLGDHDLDEDKVDQLLALRGLLSCGLLVHGLQKRTRVDFGVNRSPTARKSLAVPFRAADVPSERSEFSHPDSALLLTTRAYYSDGLSRQELLAALNKLLAMGLNAQRDHYNEWYGLSKDHIPQAQRPKLDDVSKLDPSNGAQLELLHKYYSHNMAVVDFWLNQCVFPIQTKQYPQRLSANSWNLADNAQGRVVGFSGTNDNHRLLPLQVQQAELEEPSLKGTNGKMLAIVLRDTQGFSTIAMSKGQAGDRPVWQSCLDLAVSLQLDALLDCGALLAGITNREASIYLIERLDKSRYQGVCYYDAAERSWMMREAQGRCLPRNSSPVTEARAFVLYDDARCRGADLQLRPDAVGLLTLGPSTCKDKMMQAAGRLRLLGRGQKLRLVGTEDVTRRIHDLNKMDASVTPGAREVLQWVMHNTVQATLQGILEWSRQGSFFAATRGRPERVLQDEVLELHEMYDAKRELQDVGRVVEGIASRYLVTARPGRPLAEGMPELLARICQLAAHHGQGHRVVLGQSEDEECEREIEQEEEEEQEAEVEVARMEPAKEVDWPYRLALDAGSPQVLQQAAGVQPLQGLVGQLQLSALDEVLRAIPWSQRVHCTANFVSTVRTARAHRDYLRPVHSLLLFPDSQVLMVSEREADALLEVLWRGQQGGSSGAAGYWKGPVLLSLSSVARGGSGSSSSGSPWALARRVSSSTWAWQGMQQGARMEEPELASLQLFDGQTMFGSPKLCREVLRMMNRKRKAAEELTSMRGKQALLPRSHLEQACEGTLKP